MYTYVDKDDQGHDSEINLAFQLLLNLQFLGTEGSKMHGILGRDLRQVMVVKDVRRIGLAVVGPVYVIYFRFVHGRR